MYCQIQLYMIDTGKRLFYMFLTGSALMHCLFIFVLKPYMRENDVKSDTERINVSLGPSWRQTVGEPASKRGGVQYAEACNLLGEHKFEEAVELFNGYLKQSDPSVRTDVLLKRADALMGMNEYDQAEEDLKEVIKEGKHGATPLLYSAVLYHNLDQDEDAYKALKGAYSMNPDLENDPYFTDRMEKNYNRNAALADFYTIAGKIAHDAGHSEEGLQYIDKAIEKGAVTSVSSLAYLEKALIYFKNEKYDEARKYAKVWLEKYAPNPIISVESNENFSDAYMMLGDYTQALGYINKAIRIRSDFPGFYINRGRIFVMKGDYNAAREDFAKARSLGDRGESYDAVELKRLESLILKMEKSR